MNRFTNPTSRMECTLGLSALVVLVLANGSFAGLNKTRFDVQRRVHNINVLKLEPLTVNPAIGKVDDHTSEEKNQLAANTAPSMVESMAQRWADLPPWANTVRQIRCPGAPSQKASTTAGTDISSTGNSPGDSAGRMAESHSDDSSDYAIYRHGLYSHSGQEHRWIDIPQIVEWLH